MADVVLLRVIRFSYGRTWSGTRLLRTATAAHTGNFKMLWLTLVKDRPGIKKQLLLLLLLNTRVILVVMNTP